MMSTDTHPPKLREIQRLRAVAVLMIMVLHSRDLRKLLPEIFSETWGGVDLFFVISGYVVTLSLQRLLPPLEEAPDFLSAFDQAKGALRVFYARRFFRILPAALAVILLDRILCAVYPPIFGSPTALLKETVAFLGGLYNYTAARDQGGGALSVYWSLSVEEHFYLILPMLFVAFRTKRSRLAASLVVGSCSALARAVSGAGIFYLHFASHLRFDSLMAGVALALMTGRAPVASSPMMPKSLMRFALLPGALLLIACLPGAAPVGVMVREGFIALWVLSALLVAFAALDSDYVLAFPVIAPVLEFVGARSYALYLCHRTCVRLENAIGKLWPAYTSVIPTGGDHPWGRAAAQLLLSLLVAEVLHRAVERPFMKLGRVATDPARRAAFIIPPRAKWLAAAVGLMALFWGRHAIVSVLPSARNLALRRKVTMSSHQKGSKGSSLTDGVIESSLGARTQREESPWMTIDLGRRQEIRGLRVYNREDGSHEQQLPLEVAVSDDGQLFRVIARRTTMFSSELPWRVRPGTQWARYVRLQVPAKGELSLAEVEIFNVDWPLRVP